MMLMLRATLDSERLWGDGLLTILYGVNEFYEQIGTFQFEPLPYLLQAVKKNKYTI